MILNTIEKMQYNTKRINAALKENNLVIDKAQYNGSEAKALVDLNNNAFLKAFFSKHFYMIGDYTINKIKVNKSWMGTKECILEFSFIEGILSNIKFGVIYVKDDAK